MLSYILIKTIFFQQLACQFALLATHTLGSILSPPSSVDFMLRLLTFTSTTSPSLWYVISVYLWYMDRGVCTSLHTCRSSLLTEQSDEKMISRRPGTWKNVKTESICSKLSNLLYKMSQLQCLAYTHVHVCIWLLSQAFFINLMWYLPLYLSCKKKIQKLLVIIKENIFLS